jgi:hypothetical protein
MQFAVVMMTMQNSKETVTVPRSSVLCKIGQNRLLSNISVPDNSDDVPATLRATHSHTPIQAPTVLGEAHGRTKRSKQRPTYTELGASERE